MSSRVRKDAHRRHLVCLHWRTRFLIKARLVDERPSSVLLTDPGSPSRLLTDGSREASLTRIRNRCVDTGNPRFPIRWFRRSGLRVREMALSGRLPGVHKRSW